MPKKYRKKPVVIEALLFEYSPAGITALKQFCPHVTRISTQRQKLRVSSLHWKETTQPQKGTTSHFQ